MPSAESFIGRSGLHLPCFNLRRINSTLSGLHAVIIRSYHASMTGLLTIEAQERASGEPSTLPSSHHMLSQQSSELDYEIAQQLVQHSQEARDGSRGDIITSAKDIGVSPTSVIDGTCNGDTITRDDEHEIRKRQSPPRSPLQDRPREGQYAPLTNAPAMGQVCR